ncbi:hypothetical protein PtB15_18B242 [Puccinia triticina]|nr:hypothetical protein PtB15_18B242 [Puccinia triticina]
MGQILDLAWSHLIQLQKICLVSTNSQHLWLVVSPSTLGWSSLPAPSAGRLSRHLRLVVPPSPRPGIPVR